MMPQLKNTMPKQRGFSLIEAIIAFLILSIGMLGIASLQALSLKAGYSARLNTMVVIKAEEMFERIRNNPAALDPLNPTSASYESETVDLGTSYGCSTSGGTVNLCNYAEIARDDIYIWKTDLRASLPGDTNTASIAVVPKSAGNPVATVTITINWQDRNREVQSMEDMSYSFSTHICDSTRC